MSGKRILGGSQTAHDQSWYDGELYYCAERYSRIKHNFQRIGFERTWEKRAERNRIFFEEQIYSKMKNQEYDILACTIPFNQTHYNYPELIPFFLECWEFVPERLFDNVYHDYFFYADHHQSHAVQAYLHSGFEESDILAYDGGACSFETMWVDKDQKITDLTKDHAFGKLWNAAGILCGYNSEADAGKVMGMAGYGKVNDLLLSYLDKLYRGQLGHIHEAESFLFNLCRKENINKVDIAATVQHLSNRELSKLIEQRQTSNNICLSGGVAYNGYMNELLTKHYDNVFVPPAVGDEGQSIGIYMMAEYVINGNVHIPNVYSGQKWDINETIFSGIEKC
jgi:carbamoyltransferase